MTAYRDTLTIGGEGILDERDLQLRMSKSEYTLHINKLLA